MKCAYIYYHIDPEQAGLAAAQVDALLTTLAAHCSQPPRRLNRCDDPTTWLEIYEGIADFAAFASALGEAALDLNCAAFTRDERHLECFSTPAP
ncbi:MAG TPA: DUF4936 family protein [Azonexus sp.]|nr:DUF4936 family protein [Azonexus sp.]